MANAKLSTSSSIEQKLARLKSGTVPQPTYQDLDTLFSEGVQAEYKRSYDQITKNNEASQVLAGILEVFTKQVDAQRAYVKEYGDPKQIRAQLEDVLTKGGLWKFLAKYTPGKFSEYFDDKWYDANKGNIPRLMAELGERTNAILAQFWTNQVDLEISNKKVGITIDETIDYFVLERQRLLGELKNNLVTQKEVMAGLESRNAGLETYRAELQTYGLSFTENGRIAPKDKESASVSAATGTRTELLDKIKVYETNFKERNEISDKLNQLKLEEWRYEKLWSDVGEELRINEDYIKPRNEQLGEQHAMMSTLYESEVNYGQHTSRNISAVNVQIAAATRYAKALIDNRVLKAQALSAMFTQSEQLLKIVKDAAETSTYNETELAQYDVIRKNIDGMLTEIKNSESQLSTLFYNVTIGASSPQ
ncbi:MAG: hypothetical protein AABW92_02340 [Nanoarchaeota archaeon]